MNFIINSNTAAVLETAYITSVPRIGHLNLRVSDLDRATEFYREVLGLTVSYYGPAVGLPTVFLAFDDYHHHIALNWFYRDSRLSTPGGQTSLNHFALAYPDELSLAGAVVRLLQHGDLIEDALDHGGTISVYLRDPDGNGIELYYDRPRTQWFDSAGQLVIKAEPFNVRRWLKEAWCESVEEVDQELCAECVEVHR